jgi:uncharacterized membrane protein YeaQ/YmgE (transglycosylase-associated protein family)
MGWFSWIIFGALAGFIYQWTTGKAWTFDWDWASFGVACLGAVGLLLIINLITGASRSRR